MGRKDPTKTRIPVACSAGEVDQLIRELLDQALVQSAAPLSSCGIDQLNVLRNAIEGFREAYLSAWAKVFGKPVDPSRYSQDWIVGQAYCASIDEIRKKRNNPSFFRAHVSAIASVLRHSAWHFTTHVNRFREQDRVKAAEAGRRHMRELGISAAELLQWFAIEQGLNVNYGIRLRDVRHHWELYRTTVGLWNGYFLQDSWASAAVIRQAIEVRIRHAVKIMGLRVDGQFRPASLLDIIDALSHEKEASSQVDWATIRRIYRWANMYAHTAYSPFLWMPGYAIMVLQPLMCGRQTDGKTTSPEDGITLTEAARARIHEAVKKGARVPVGADVEVESFPMEPRSAITSSSEIKKGTDPTHDKQ